MASRETGKRGGWEQLIAPWGWNEVGGSEQLSCASLLFLGGVFSSFFVGSLIIIIFQSSNCSYLSPGVLSFFPILFLIPLGGRVRDCMVLNCQLGLKYTDLLPALTACSQSPDYFYNPSGPIPHSVLFFLFHLPLNLSCSSCSICFASPLSSTILYLTISSTTFVAKTTQDISGLRQLPHLQCLDCRRKIKSIGEGYLAVPSPIQS